MINRDRYFEAQQHLKEVRHALNSPHLTEDRRAELQHHEHALSAVVLRPWLPVSWTRRLLMAVIFLFGLQQAAAGNYEALAWWFLLPVLSPRLSVEILHWIRVKRLQFEEGLNSRRNQ